MKTLATILLFITLGAAFANKAALQSLAEIDKDPFGSTILSAISLNLRAKTPISDVSDLIQSIYNDLSADLQTLESATEEKRESLAAAIENDENTITQFNNLIDNLRESIANDEQTVVEKQDSLRQENEDLVRERERKAAAEERLRVEVPELEADIADLAAAQSAVTSAIDKMNQYLASAGDSAAFIQIASSTKKDIEKVSAAFEKMGKTLSKRSALYTPLVRELIALTNNMEQGKAQRVINLLEQLLSLLATAQTDRENDLANLIRDQNEIIDDATTNIATHEANIATLEAEIAALEARIEQSKEELRVDIEIRDAAVVQLQADREELARVNAFYDDQQPRYQRSIEVLRKIMDLFGSNISTVDEYTRSKVEGEEIATF